jgi:hypothetical protein
MKQESEAVEPEDHFIQTRLRFIKQGLEQKRNAKAKANASETKELTNPICKFQGVCKDFTLNNRGFL